MPIHRMLRARVSALHGQLPVFQDRSERSPDTVGLHMQISYTDLRFRLSFTLEVLSPHLVPPTPLAHGPGLAVDDDRRGRLVVTVRLVRAAVARRGHGAARVMLLRHCLPPGRAVRRQG